MQRDNTIEPPHISPSSISPPTTPTYIPTPHPSPLLLGPATKHIHPSKLIPCCQYIQSRTIQFRLARRIDNEDISVGGEPGEDEVEAASFDDEFGKRVGG